MFSLSSSYMYCSLVPFCTAAQVRDKVGSVTKSSKASALREKCQAALGVNFAQVYAFLRKTREMDSSTVGACLIVFALLMLPVVSCYL